MLKTPVRFGEISAGAGLDLSGTPLAERSLKLGGSEFHSSQLATNLKAVRLSAVKVRST